MTTGIALFFLYFTVIICIIDLPLIKGTTRSIPKDVFMYAGAMAMLGPIAEVAINHFCRAVFDYTLWQYKVLPVHDGDTSLISTIEWGIYGYHLYFLHKKVKSFHFKYENYIFIILVSIDGPLIEAVINICGLLFLDTFIFYYFPSDLYHLTSLFAVPFYAIGGFAMSRTLKGFSADPWFFGATGFCTSYIFVFL